MNLFQKQRLKVQDMFPLTKFMYRAQCSSSSAARWPLASYFSSWVMSYCYLLTFSCREESWKEKKEIQATFWQQFLRYWLFIQFWIRIRQWSVINWWAGEKETHKKEKEKKDEWICKTQGQEESKEEKERDKRQVSGCNYTTNTSIHKHLTNTYKKCKYDKNEYCE